MEKARYGRKKGKNISVLHISSTGFSSFFQEQISELEARGVECDVVTGERKKHSRPGSLGSKIHGLFGQHSVLNYAYLSAQLYREVLRKTRSNEYDIVHANSGLAGPFAVLQLQKPRVISYWGSDLMGDYLYGVFPRISRLCARVADANIVMNDQMATGLPGDCYVIPHGVDLEKFRPIERSEAIESVGWNPDHANVLFPYNPSRRIKNAPLAEEITSTVDDRLDRPVSFHTVFDELHEEIPLYMNAADLMLVTSHREGSPNTVKEAMACNLPVVSRDVGDVRDQLVSVDNSYVCDTTDEMIDRSEEILRHRPRSTGRQHVREYAKERMGNRLLDVYTDVLDDAADE